MRGAVNNLVRNYSGETTGYLVFQVATGFGNSFTSTFIGTFTAEGCGLAS